jgi:hypothetical protein
MPRTLRAFRTSPPRHRHKSAKSEFGYVADLASIPNGGDSGRVPPCDGGSGGWRPVAVFGPFERPVGHLALNHAGAAATRASRGRSRDHPPAGSSRLRCSARLRYHLIDSRGGNTSIAIHADNRSPAGDLICPRPRHAPPNESKTTKSPALPLGATTYQLGADSHSSSSLTQCQSTPGYCPGRQARGSAVSSARTVVRRVSFPAVRRNGSHPALHGCGLIRSGVQGAGKSAVSAG